MMQNIGGFLTLAWLWSKRDKTLDEVPVEEEVSDNGIVIPAHCKTLTPGTPAYISCVTGGALLENGNGFDLNGNGNDIIPSNGEVVCPPTESRLDLSTADTINYDPIAHPPCGCPPGYRKVEVKRGKYQTATRCYNGV